VMLCCEDWTTRSGGGRSADAGSGTGPRKDTLVDSGDSALSGPPKAAVYIRFACARREV
jgi:hypothetical protein